MQFSIVWLWYLLSLMMQGSLKCSQDDLSFTHLPFYYISCFIVMFFWWNSEITSFWFYMKCLVILFYLLASQKENALIYIEQVEMLKSVMYILLFFTILYDMKEEYRFWACSCPVHHVIWESVKCKTRNDHLHQQNIY